MTKADLNWKTANK